ncbi:MAG: transcription-repair coupling factor [Trueperaceae bacterium]|nr:transcription-repair coupling factor [Trueperaceae bacterium]
MDRPSASGVRELGLPSVARLARFARHPGEAVLLTTSDRAERFESAGAFGVAAALDPDLDVWSDRPEKVVLTLDHALRAFPRDPARYRTVFEVGGSHPRDELLTTLDAFGYPRDETPGTAVHGDSVTIFLTEDPEGPQLRLGFFGDELDELRLNGREVAAHVLSPRRDAPLFEEDEEGWDGTVLEALPGTVFLDVPELYAGTASDTEAERLWTHLAERSVVSFGRDPLTLDARPSSLTPLPYYRARLDEFAADAEGWLRDGYAVTLLLRFERTGRYLTERVVGHLAHRWGNGVSDRAGELTLALAGRPEGGYRDDAQREVVLTEDLLYGHQGGRKLRRLPGRAVQDASQLTVGDYLIHPDHGVALFQGLESRQVLGVARDYLKLRYAAEGRLFLPVEQLPLLRRHPGTSDVPPKLSTLGTNEWSRAKEKARVSAQELAAELIKTYAKRQVSQGTAFPQQPEWDPLVEKNFPFVLTPDQATSVSDTLADMERSIPMDRLISGDVGFGKTEVAIRAAMRAVANGHQVAMLVPTTVLAKQHYDTIAERVAGLPVNVALLSRFTSDAGARAALTGLADGTVDVVIGTHRLLNEGIKYESLGLLIIDEEHRFGVGQKEKLKALRANLDVLSLSATPIPRTLYMSLVGLRDVSQIMTPPEGRQPIQTVLQPYDPMTVRSAIVHELERGGKTYYIHDRIGSMSMRARTLQQLVPEARIGVAHGQMAADELEAIMLGFEEGAFDVLLATTIVESGLDVAGANTLIIERADRLGLAQLYQLRGRVGRRQTEAWAYLLYPGRLTEQAQRRLYAIAELNDLGSGHLLAEKDMEIRGVGNLLGPEQHGHVSAVSLEVYTELLAEEVSKLKGEEKAEKRPAVSLDLNLDARLTPAYLPDDDERIAFYGRLAEAEGLAEVSRIARELRSARGPFPPEVKAFLELVKLRLLAEGKGVAAISEHMTDVQVTFRANFDELDYDPRKLRDLAFTAEATRYPPGFSVKKRGLASADVPQALQQLLYAVG